VAAGVPLATLLGASPRPIPAYNSCGLGLMAPDAAADEAEALLAGGFKAVKLRLGYPTLAEDLAVTGAVRRRLADDIAIMVDFNQALTVAQALERGHALEGEGVYWIEEPIRHDNLAGHVTLTRALALPIQIGENFDGAKAMAQALDAGACDFVMPDAGRIGGVTGWQQAAGIAASRDVEMSSHLMARIRRLGQRDPGGAARGHGRPRHRVGTARHRPRLERRGSDTLPPRMTHRTERRT
jgi:mandelate racemase